MLMICLEAPHQLFASPVETERAKEEIIDLIYQWAPKVVQAAFEHRPDLCILDVAMPAGGLGCDDRDTGFEVCRRIKADDRVKDIPVLFLTARMEAGDRIKGLEVGGHDYLSKPIDFGRLEALLHAVRDDLDRRRRLLEVEANAGRMLEECRPAREKLLELYAGMGRALARFTGWRVACFVSNPRFVEAFGHAPAMTKPSCCVPTSASPMITLARPHTTIPIPIWTSANPWYCASSAPASAKHSMASPTTAARGTAQ